MLDYEHSGLLIHVVPATMMPSCGVDKHYRNAWTGKVEQINAREPLMMDGNSERHSEWPRWGFLDSEGPWTEVCVLLVDPYSCRYSCD